MSAEYDNFFWARKHAVEFDNAMRLLTQEQYDLIMGKRHPSPATKVQQKWIKDNVREPK